MRSWFANLAFTTASPTIGEVLVASKVNRVGNWDQILLTDTLTPLAHQFCVLGGLSLGIDTSGMSSVGLLNVGSISGGSVALPAKGIS